MIARLLRAIHRRALESEIKHMEDDLAGIAKQRENDIEAEKMIGRELIVARRQLQAMAQEDVHQATADNVRRMKL